MRYVLLLFVMILSTGICRAYDIQYEISDSLCVVSLLADARKQQGIVNYIIYFARQLKNIPYVAHTLEVNKTEKLVVNLRQLDCTTYVENVLALYLCMRQRAYAFRNFCDNLCRIRYNGGDCPDYTKRLHYFTEWIEDNSLKGICSEIQTPIPPFSGIQKINVYYMSANPDKYKMLRANPRYIPLIADTEKEISKKSYKYIPKSGIRNSELLRKIIHDGDIIAITTNLQGLDIQHVGFAVWHDDGMHLLNASSIHRKVVEEQMTLYDYLRRKASMTGVRVIRISE